MSKITVGLTGGIASGKSLVFREWLKLGAIGVDCDLISREVVLPGTNGLKKVVRAFGERVLNPDRTLNRGILGKIIFSDKRMRAALESALHPIIIAEITKRIKESGPGLVVVDIPLLHEANLERLVDKVVLVWANQKVRIARLKKRNQLNLKEARQRIAAQWPLSRKKKMAHYIINNSGSAASTLKQARALFRQLKNNA